MVLIKVMNESTKGNIGLFQLASSLAVSKVFGILMMLEVANMIMSIMILPTKPAISAQRVLRAISDRIIFLGQNDIIIYVLYNI